MGPIQSIDTCFLKFATFNGRASRSEYWWFFLFTTMVLLGVETLRVIFLPDDDHLDDVDFFVTYIFDLLYCFIWIPPTVAVSARRLHDLKTPGWPATIVPIHLLLYIAFIFKGTKGDNRYGSDPLVGDGSPPPHAPMDAGPSIIQTFRDSFLWQGRTNRLRYLYWLGFKVVFYYTFLPAFYLEYFINEESFVETMMDDALYSLPFIAFYILTLAPSIAITIRRLHDMDIPGYWSCFFYVPVLGLLGIILLALQDGTKGANRFGDAAC